MHAPNPKSEPKKAQNGAAMDTLVKAESLLQIAFVLPAAVLIGWGGGVLLDRWLHTHWIYIVGLLLGAAAGLLEVVRQALRAGGKQE
ncbi:MAG TPA: AtpZ/AtpI family protein [Silvibacterium sp.]|nr:AtpZ/AtpI family protein [Silvibacterium sp.]